MNSESILIWLVVGAVAGWLAGQFIKGGGFGLIGNIVVGIIGSVIAGYLLPLMGVQLGAGFVRAAVVGSSHRPPSPSRNWLAVDRPFQRSVDRQPAVARPVVATPDLGAYGVRCRPRGRRARIRQ